MTSSTHSSQQAAVTEGPDAIVVKNVDVPVAGPGEALLRIETVGICGTDLKILSGGFLVEYPLVQGHELSAIVEQLPEGYVGGLEVGDRVAVNPPVPCGHCYACSLERWSTCETMSVVGVNRPGALQERMTMPVQNCYPVGDLDAEVAAVCETLSVGLRAVTRPSVAAGDRVLILGAGPIGLAALIASLDVGATAMVVDQARSRREHALELGADLVGDDLATVADAARQWTDGTGPSVVVDAIGLASSLELAFEVVAVAGRISIVGISQQVAQIGARTFTAKELSVFGSRGTLDFASAVALATRRRDQVSSLISHRFRLADIDDAFRIATTRPDDVVKCLIQVGVEPRWTS